MTRRDLLPQIAVATLAAYLTGCLAFPPAPAEAPTPTVLEPAGHSRVEVVWDNSSDDAFVVSIVGAELEQQAFALVEPCSAHNVIQFVDPPFEIGVGQRDSLVREPMPTVVHSRDLDEAPDGQYRVHVSIGPDGAISSQPLTGYGSWEPPTGLC
jgi:hypothetical protein